MIKLGEFVLISKEKLYECKQEIFTIIKNLNLTRKSKKHLKKSLIEVYEKLET